MLNLASQSSLTYAQSGPLNGRQNQPPETSLRSNFGEVSGNELNPFPPGEPSIRENGTGFASFLSDAANIAHNEKKKQSPRNHADRQSLALKVEQVGNLIAAEQHSRSIGLPFTRMITILWEEAGVPLDKMANATGRYIDLLTKTIKRHGGETSWIWVHENGERKGGHVHILAHIPSSLVQLISKRNRRWIRKISGKRYQRKVVLSKPLGGRLGLERTNPALLASNVCEALSYCLKGADEEGLETFRLTRSNFGGLIIGKRCGTSQNIGPKARKPLVAQC